VCKLNRPKNRKSLIFFQEFIGSEFAIFKLGVSGVIRVIEVDTNHFKGNFPDSISIDGAQIRSAENEDEDEKKWTESPQIWTTQILPLQKLGPHRRHFFLSEIFRHESVTHVKISIKPDGGISRIRLLGVV
jgi:allantoicase